MSPVYPRALADVTDPIVWDHLRLLQDEAYRARVVSHLHTWSPGVLVDVVAVHEPDQVCCRIETWADTFARILTEAERS